MMTPMLMTIATTCNNNEDHGDGTHDHDSDDDDDDDDDDDVQGKDNGAAAVEITRMTMMTTMIR